MKVFKLASLYLKHVFSASQEEEKEMLAWHKTRERFDLEEAQKPTARITESQPFSIEVLKEIDAQTKNEVTSLLRINNYVSSKLKLVGSGKGEGRGSTRLVYEWGDKVIKVAYRHWGLYQNRMESRINNRSPLFAKVFDSHPRDCWIVSEKITPFSGAVDFNSNTGLDPVLLKRYCKMPEKLEPSELGTVSRMHRLTQEATTLLRDIINLKYQYNFPCGDLCEPTHWGTSTDGSLKIFDYGAESEAVKEINAPDKIDEEVASTKIMFPGEDGPNTPPETVMPGSIWNKPDKTKRLFNEPPSEHQLLETRKTR